jgi:signal transduction histidine kinase
VTRVDVAPNRRLEQAGVSIGPSAVPSLDDEPGDVEDVRPDLLVTNRSVTTTPWSRSGFWLLQLAVLALYLLRLAATVGFHLDATSLVLELSTLALFMIPVVYAALTYGLVGALFTTGWVTLLAVPRFVASIHAQQYGDAWAELMQVVLLDVLAYLIGQRVSAEREARSLAESSREAHLRAEAMYRDLFDSNQAPILIVDTDGFVVESNASAQRAFGRTTSSSATGSPVRLVDMIGADAAARVLTELISLQLTGDPGIDTMPGDPDRIEPVAFDIAGEQVLFRPTATALGPDTGDRRMQVIFEDVTAETRRHDLMEAYAARVVLGQEEERRHIAQELHDGPLQTLIHLCRQIDEVDSALHAAPSVERLAPLGQLRGIVEGTVAELRSIAKGLRPSILDDLGLVASINQMLADAGTRQGFETSFGVNGAERRLSPTVELALFRIAQEAISNIERHAAARRVAVGMNFEPGGLRLLVKDDGVGFTAADQTDSGRSASLGLPGMTERAHLIGSRLIVHSEPGVGTTVDVWVPATILDGV